MYRYIMQQLYQSRKIYNNRKVPCINNSVNLNLIVVMHYTVICILY